MRESQKDIARQLDYNGAMKVLPYPVIVDDIKVFEKDKVHNDDISRQYTILFPASPDRPEKNFDLFSKSVEFVRTQGYNIRIKVLGGLNRAEVLNRVKESDIVIYGSSE